MNYNEILYDNNTKYNYTINETDQQIYIFELVLKTSNNEELIFRSIKKNKQGNIDINNNILFDIINKFKLTILNMNDTNNKIIIKKIIDHSNNSNIYLNDKIYLEINKKNNFIEFNYNIINL